MNSENNMIPLIIFIATFILLTLLISLIKKKVNSNTKIDKYDERQKIIQGKGYAYGFYTLLAYNALYGCFSIFIDKTLADPLVSGVFGIAISVCVFAVYCIWKDAYLAINDNINMMILVFGLISLSNGFSSYSAYKHGLFISDGILTYKSVSLPCFLFTAVIFVALVIKKISTKSEED